MGTLLIIFVGLVVYGIPLILFLFLHYLYVKAGRYVSHKLSHDKLRLLFWLSYISFGVILVYTNLIWSVKEASVEHEKGRYTLYHNYFSSQPNDYKKVTISGVIDSQLNVEFEVPLISRGLECSDLHTYTTSYMGEPHVVEYIKYPLLKPGPYSIDIFLENHKQSINCQFTHGKFIGVHIYGDKRQQSISYGHIATTADGYQTLSFNQAKVVYQDQKHHDKTTSFCKFENDVSSERYIHGKEATISINIDSIGSVTGNTYYSQKPINIVDETIQTIKNKVFIFDFPLLFDPAPSTRRACKETKFIEAIYKNDVSLVTKFIKNRELSRTKDLLNVRTCSGTYATSIFAARANYKMFIYLLENGARTNMPGQDIFRSAFKGGDPKIIKYLIENNILDEFERDKALKAAEVYRYNPLANQILNTETVIENGYRN